MKKRKKINKGLVAFIIIFILLCLTIGVYIILGSSSKDTINYKKNFTIKVGEDVPVKIEYKLNNEKKETSITWKKLKLEDGKLYLAGKYDGMFMVDNKSYSVTLSVIDDEKPVIEGACDIEIYKGDEVDLIKNIKTTDNSHDEIDLKVIGKYDVNKPGEYELTYEAKDKSDNVETVKFKLIVKEIEEVNNNSNNVTKTSKGFDVELRDGITYIGGVLIANKTYSLPDTYAPGLLGELNDAFASLQSDASANGLSIYIISGFRSYWDQSYIYNNYVARDGQALADTYSARPGHSEHQSGLAVDVNSLETWFGDTNEGIWLKNNCYKYGFIIRYPYGKDSITGYQYEPWHIRYVGKDIATALYNNGDWITLEEYLGIDSYYH